MTSIRVSLGEPLDPHAAQDIVSRLRANPDCAGGLHEEAAVLILGLLDDVCHLWAMLKRERTLREEWEEIAYLASGSAK